MTCVDAELGGHGVGYTQADESIIRTEIGFEEYRHFYLKTVMN